MIKLMYTGLIVMLNQLLHTVFAPHWNHVIAPHADTSTNIEFSTLSTCVHKIVHRRFRFLLRPPAPGAGCFRLLLPGGAVNFFSRTDRIRSKNTYRWKNEHAHNPIMHWVTIPSCIGWCLGETDTNGHLRMH